MFVASPSFIFAYVFNTTLTLFLMSSFISPVARENITKLQYLLQNTLYTYAEIISSLGFESSKDLNDTGSSAGSKSQVGDGDSSANSRDSFKAGNKLDMNFISEKVERLGILNDQIQSHVDLLPDSSLSREELLQRIDIVNKECERVSEEIELLTLIIKFTVLNKSKMATLFSLDDTSLNDDDISVINFNVERSISPLYSIIRSSVNSACVLSQTAGCLKELEKVQPLSCNVSYPAVNLGYTENITILKKFGKKFALLFNRHRQYYNKRDLLSTLEELSSKVNDLKKDIEAEVKTIFMYEKVNSKYYPLSKDSSLLGVTENETDLTILYIRDKLEASSTTISQSKKRIVRMYLEFAVKLFMCLKLLNENIHSTSSAINSEVTRELVPLKTESNNDIRCCNIEPTKVSLFKLLSLSYHKFSLEIQKESTFQDLSKMMTLVKETLDDAVSEGVTEFSFDDQLVKLYSILDTDSASAT
nr:hypothetical protein MACL_00000835 [Theileria orientalis]